MLNKKNIILHLLSLCVLCIGFVLCRYVFFDIHGIMGLPVWLFVVGMVSMAISFFLEGKTTPIFTALAYIIGFIAGAIFQTNGVDAGGGTAPHTERGKRHPCPHRGRDRTEAVHKPLLVVAPADTQRHLHSSFRNLKQKEKSIITNTAPATYLAGADVFILMDITYQ